MLSHEIMGIVSSIGVKASVIARELNKPINSISGSLTSLKHQGKVYNKDGLWYSKKSNVIMIKDYLYDINVVGCKCSINNSWSDGFITGYHMSGYINDLEYDELLKWMKTFNRE